MLRPTDNEAVYYLYKFPFYSKPSLNPQNGAEMNMQQQCDGHAQRSSTVDGSRLLRIPHPGVQWLEAGHHSGQESQWNIP
ncbi:unnamed protein product [Penicillium camemberti]|uniref:Str. FM013 n=1 Tax=Penicillium camemberti (strain FM 013) TaxID=1429867 RepID=A0A0G4PMK2_PENC3|nr:unnamed protein product [Penicillium camemberti]